MWLLLYTYINANVPYTTADNSYYLSNNNNNSEKVPDIFDDNWFWFLYKATKQENGSK